MHAIFFSAKRAFNGVLRVTREPLQEQAEGLTAARFDLLYALLQHPLGAHCATFQSKLRRCLGVCPSVVSRMVDSLVKLGWVTKTKSAIDRRQREIRLTRSGLRCIRGALGPMLSKARELVHQAICFGRHQDQRARLLHLDTLEGYLLAMRRHYDDGATLDYPWGHPDD